MSLKGADRSLHMTLTSISSNLEEHVNLITFWKSFDVSHEEIKELRNHLSIYGDKFQQFINAVGTLLVHLQAEELLTQQILMVQSRLICQEQKLAMHYENWIVGLMQLQNCSFMAPTVLVTAVATLK